ncbi:hypothetical protein [Nitrobacter sp. JJSN]
MGVFPIGTARPEKLAGDLTLQPGETSLVRKLFQSAWVMLA